jgi:hypothetical protein
MKKPLLLPSTYRYLIQDKLVPSFQCQLKFQGHEALWATIARYYRLSQFGHFEREKAQWMPL